MNFKSLVKLTIATILLGLGLLDTAGAITVSGKCYVNASRSRITVAVAGEAGSYFVSVFSGDNVKTSKIKPTNVNNVVYFAFDSDPLVYSTGKAVAIARNFIQDNTVIIRLRDAATSRLVGKVAPTCTPI